MNRWEGDWAMEDWLKIEKEGRTITTRNGRRVKDIRPYKPASLIERVCYEELNPLIGTIEGPEFPYAIWGRQGKALYVHNYEMYDLSPFDLTVS